MARKPNDPKPNDSRPDPRKAAVEAMMALVAERGWRDVELVDVAARSGVALSTLRDLFPSKGAMLAGFGRMLDREVIDGVNPDLMGEPAKERVFDVMMRRLDVMAPYKPALREIRDAVRGDLLSAAALNQAALNSWRYLLGSVGIPVEDELGMLKIQGAVLVFARVVDVWLDDEDPSMARTMATIDRELKRGGQVLRFAEDARRLTAPLRGLASAMFSRAPRPRRRERADDGHTQAV